MLLKVRVWVTQETAVYFGEVRETTLYTRPLQYCGSMPRHTPALECLNNEAAKVQSVFENRVSQPEKRILLSAQLRS